MRVLKQSTAATVMVGPFLDKTDGVTEEAGLAGVGTELSKAGGAYAAGPVLGTHDSDGWYPISLTTTHTNTLGDLTLKVHDNATHLPVWMHFTVLPANSYDALVAGSGVGMRSDVQGWLGTAPATPTTNGVPEVDLTHIAGAAVSTTSAQLGVNVVNAGGTAWGSGAITAASIAADAITDAKVAADVTIASVTGAVGSVTGAVGSVTGAVGSVTGNVGGNVAGSVGSVTAAVTVGTNNDKTGYGLSAAAVQAIWDALTAALTTVGSIGKLLVDNINATISSRLASASYTAPLDAAGTRTAVGLAAANLDTQLTAIDDFLDTEVAAIKAKTDQLTFTVANQVDANTESINATTVLGTGAAGDLWRG